MLLGKVNAWWQLGLWCMKYDELHQDQITLIWIWMVSPSKSQVARYFIYNLSTWPLQLHEQLSSNFDYKRAFLHNRSHHKFCIKQNFSLAMKAIKMLLVINFFNPSCRYMFKQEIIKRKAFNKTPRKGQIAHESLK